MPKSTQIFRVKISWFVVGSCLGKAIPTEIHRPLDKMEVEPISAGIPYIYIPLRAGKYLY